METTNEDESQQPIVPNGGVQQSMSVSSVVSTGLEQLKFFSGNTPVEKTTGILHFYKNKSALEIMHENCLTLCMMEIPAHVACSEFLRFIQPGTEKILESKIVRDSSPNQYFVILKFRTASDTFSFYQEYNGLRFNSLETAQCNLLFIERLEITTEKSEKNELTDDPTDTPTEQPTCAVCLERMEGDGLLTILCNHTFHAECLQKWEGSLCPVCRFHQTPELIPDQTCSVCGNTTDLWMCLICGNIGCGRYNGAHAYIHFEETSHTFTKSLGQELVWDYAGDNFVHRLIQGSIDGKMVELQGRDEPKSEENEAIEIEVAQLFSSQMETQRLFFDGKIREIKDKYFALEKSANNTIRELEGKVASTSNENEALQTRVTTTETEKANLEKKYQKLQQITRKLQSELEEERQLAKIIGGDKQALIDRNTELEKLRITEIKNLEEQVNDLMAHFEAQNKLSQQMAKANVTIDDVQEGSIGVEKAQGSKRKTKRNK